MELASTLPTRFAVTPPRSLPSLLIAYALGLLILHILPLGGLGLNGGDLGPVGLEDLRVDHLVHIAMLFPLGVILATLLIGRRGCRGRLWAIAGLAGGLAVAAGAECLQYWLPYRSFNWADLLCNLTGVFAGILIMFVWRSIQSRLHVKNSESNDSKKLKTEDL